MKIKIIIDADNNSKFLAEKISNYLLEEFKYLNLHNVKLLDTNKYNLCFTGELDYE